ncbi:hypothetical protein BG57_14420 [Caballeronia grimmiae]|uniref:Uncharacterized protein n=1 Tax=Caballeronia grimmiae TaxID=1071679 RepID=A0A069NQU1_9BURK|nr:hypothetical protein BG57_14420 [Caballeronia grimmiae]
MMVDHTKLMVQLRMAAPHGVKVPKDNSYHAVLDALRPLKGKAFALPISRPLMSKDIKGGRSLSEGSTRGTEW